jgi:hypothetical protein
MSARTSDPEAGLPAYDEDKKGVEVGHLEESVTVKGADKIDLTGYVYVPDTPEERALVRKIDIHILPMLWVMYIMNYVSSPAREAPIGGGTVAPHRASPPPSYSH